MNNEERFMELISRSSDKDTAVEIAIEVFLSLLTPFQTQTETCPVIQQEQNGTVAS